MESTQPDPAPPTPPTSAGTGPRGRSLVRTAVAIGGGAALVACAVVLAFAVFGEPGGPEPSATWLAFALVVTYLVLGVVGSIIVTNPGRTAVRAAAALAAAALIACVATIVTMPDPGDGDWISHRQALGAYAFALAALGAGLLVLNERLARRWGPPRAPGRLIAMAAVLSVVLVAILTMAGTAATHRLAEWANTDKSVARAAPVAHAEGATFEHMGPTYTGTGAVGTPYGLMVTTAEPMAVTAYDPAGGERRWRHVRHNRTFAQPPVLSADGSEIALVGDRRDAPAGTSVVVLDTATGRVRLAGRLTTEEGSVLAITGPGIAFHPEKHPRRLEIYGLSGRLRWTYTAPENCSVGVAAESGPRIIAAMDCTTAMSAAAKPRVVALSAGDGRELWSWEGPVVGGVAPGSLAVEGDAVIVDVRRDVSTSEGLFAARQFRHDLTRLAADTGAQVWRDEKLMLGSTYSPSCAGTIRLAAGHVYLGECHHAVAGGKATYDVVAYDLAAGDEDWDAAAPLGFTPDDGSRPAQWFGVLPDGRVAIVTDASDDVAAPDCGLYLASPGGDVERLKDGETGTEALPDPAWCRTAALHPAPGSLSVSHEGAHPGVFSLR